MRSACARWTLVGMLLSVSVAAAETPSPEGIAHYKNGRALLANGEAEKALKALDASLALLPSPNTRLLRAHALRQLGRRGQAMNAYEQAWEEAIGRIRDGEERFRATVEEASHWIGQLRGELSQLRVTFGEAVGSVTLTVGAQEVPVGADGTARLWVEPGDVKVQARAEDGRQSTADVTARAGKEVALSMAFQTAAEPVAASGSADGAGAVAPPPLASLIAGGVGVVGWALFAGFGAASGGSASDLEACSPNCGPELREEADEGQRYQTVANVGLVVGVAGIAAFGGLWALSAFSDDAPTSSDEAQLTVVLTPGYLGVAGIF